MNANELEIPEVPSLTPEADGKTDKELDTEINQLVESELDPETSETIGDPRKPEEEPKGEPDPTIEPAEEPAEEEVTFAEGTTDEDKIKAILERDGGEAAVIAQRYLGARRKMTQQGQENADLKTLLADELDKRLPKVEEPKPAPVEEPAQTDEDLSTLFITDPAKAQTVVENIAKKAAQEATRTISQSQIQKEAEADTFKLIDGRARYHLLKAAKLTEDKDGVARFKDPSYVPNDAEYEAVMDVLRPEIEFAKHFQDKETGKIDPNAFGYAEAALNQNALIKDAERRGTNRTLSQIESPTNAAIIANAKGSKATSVKDGSKISSREQGKVFGRGLSDKELEKAISESEPEF